MKLRDIRWKDIKRFIFEQGDEDDELKNKKEPEVPENVEPEVPEEPDAEENPEEVMDEVPEEEEELTRREIGYVFELKKIHERLMTISRFLESSLSPKLLRLKIYVDKSINLFDFFIQNIEKFKHNIEKVILIYYSFIIRSLEIIRDAYKEDLKIKEKNKNKAEV